MSSTDLVDRLRARGFRLTPQRRVVAEVLRGSHCHLTADEIHRLAVARLPEVSRATVYNTLNELVSIGEVSEVVLDGPTKRYDPNAADGHEHLVCERCGTIFDVFPDGRVPGLSAAEARGFQLTSAAVVYRGICADCQKELGHFAT